MTQVTGHALKEPELEIWNGNDQCCRFTRREDGQRNLPDHKVYEGKQVDRWVILDFTSSGHWNQLDIEQFTQNIIKGATRAGIHMNPQFLFYKQSSVDVLSNEKQLDNTVKDIYERAEGKLQILFCLMESHHPGFNTLRRICEKEIGIVMDCFHSPIANQGNDRDYENLALKIKTKLSSSNMELFHTLPCLDYDHPVMFMGTDVNNPSSRSTSSISIATVLAANWPGTNEVVLATCAAPLDLEDPGHRQNVLNDNHTVMSMGADVNNPSSRSTSGISIAAVAASNSPGDICAAQLDLEDPGRWQDVCNYNHPVMSMGVDMNIPSNQSTSITTVMASNCPVTYEYVPATRPALPDLEDPGHQQDVLGSRRDVCPEECHQAGDHHIVQRWRRLLYVPAAFISIVLFLWVIHGFNISIHDFPRNR